MNQRTKLLTGKALDKAVPETWTTLTPYDLTKFTEVFAELIVRECAKRSEELGQPEIGLGILKHFGVEE